MITDLIGEVANYLLAQNQSWLRQIRYVGYQNRVSEGDNVTNEEMQEIGLSDRDGNSGYIRFKSNQNFTVSEIKSFNNSRASRFSYDLRMVVVVKSDTPVDINYLLALQFNHFEMAVCTVPYGTARNIKTYVTGGGSNTVANAKQESNKESWNNEYKILYVDFRLQFDDQNKCDFTKLIDLPMECNCSTIYNAGCFKICDGIELPVESDYTGTATVVTEFNGNIVKLSIEVTEGEPIVIPANELNANYVFNLAIYDEENERIEFSIDPSGTYDCIQIQTKP